MNENTRIKRPVPTRVRPNRSVLGAFNQSDRFDMSEPGKDDMHPLGPGFGSVGPEADQSGPGQSDPGSAESGKSTKTSTSDTSDFIARGVRAASDLIDRQIREGQDAARGLNRLPLGGIAAGGADLSTLLSRIMQSYSEAGSAWVELVGTLSKSAQEKEAAGGTGPRTGVTMPMVRLRTEIPCDIAVEMFRPAVTLEPQPLRVSGMDAHTITDLRADLIDDGLRSRVTVTVPRDQPAGTYHGLILSGDDRRPVGTLTVEVAPSDSDP